MKPLRLLPALLSAAGLHLAGAPALAQTLSGGPDARSQGMPSSAPDTVRVDLSSGAAAQSLSLPRGKSAIIELPVDVRDVLVTNPAVADAVLRTSRRIYLLGLAAGQTDAVFFDAAGRANIVFSDEAAEHLPVTFANQFAGQIRLATRDGGAWAAGKP